VSDQAAYGYFAGTKIPRKAPVRDEFDGKGVCRFCGQTGHGWRLFTLGGSQHQCPRGAR
jgi:hypothetical protein